MLSEEHEPEEENGNDADASFADCIMRKHKKNLSANSLKVYTSYVRRFLQYCEEQGYTNAEAHFNMIFQSKNHPLSFDLIAQHGIRPVASSEYMKAFIPVFIATGRKHNSRSWNKSARFDSSTPEPTGSSMVEAVLKAGNNLRSIEQRDLVPILRLRTDYWTTEQQNRYNLTKSVRDQGNKDFPSVISKQKADLRRQHRVDPLMDSPEAGFNLDEFADFSEWALCQTSMCPVTALLAKSLITWNTATGTRGINSEKLTFEYLYPGRLGARTLPILESFPCLNVITDKSKINQVGTKHTVSVTFHRILTMCAISTLSLIEIIRFLPEEQGGWGAEYFDFYDLESYFGVPVFCTQRDKNSKREISETTAREIISTAIKQFCLDKGMPEWRIDMYMTLYIRHLGRHLAVMNFEIAGTDGRDQDRHCKFGGGYGRNNQRTNYYANQIGCRTTTLTVAGTPLIGGFQPHVPHNSGPVASRELGMVILRRGYEQAEFLNDVSSQYWHGPMAQNYARVCALKINSTFTDILVPTFLRDQVDLQKAFPHSPLLKRFRWLLDEPLFQRYATEVSDWAAAEAARTAPESSQDIQALAAVTQSTSANVLNELRILREESACGRDEIRNRLTQHGDAIKCLTQRLESLDSVPRASSTPQGITPSECHGVQIQAHPSRQNQESSIVPVGVQIEGDGIDRLFKNVDIMLKFLPELSALDKYRQDISSGVGFGKVLDWWFNGLQVPNSSHGSRFPPARAVAEIHGLHFTTKVLIPDSQEKSKVQQQLRNRLRRLLDVVDYLEVRAGSTGPGSIQERMKSVAKALDHQRPHQLRLSGFVDIFSAANTAWGELKDVIAWCRTAESDQAFTIIVNSEKLMSDIATWKKHPFANAKFIDHKRSILKAFKELQAESRGGSGGPAARGASRGGRRGVRQGGGDGEYRASSSGSGFSLGGGGGAGRGGGGRGGSRGASSGGHGGSGAGMPGEPGGHGLPPGGGGSPSYGSGAGSGGTGSGGAGGGFGPMSGGGPGNGAFSSPVLLHTLRQIAGLIDPPIKLHPPYPTSTPPPPTPTPLPPPSSIQADPASL